MIVVRNLAEHEHALTVKIRHRKLSLQSNSTYVLVNGMGGLGSCVSLTG